MNTQVSLVIFTCEGREQLLYSTYNSFLNACSFKFSLVILAIDGPVNSAIIAHINPDLVINNYKRKGYVASIKNTLPQIDTEYFFWLEDDWAFSGKIDVPGFLTLLQAHDDWAEIIYSKFGPLTPDFKASSAGDNLYQNIYGFSCNPGLNRTRYLQEGFVALENSKKGDTLGEDGFENFLTRYFTERDIKYIIQDPVDHTIISHEGYLETTDRNWHMTNSLEQKTTEHLLTIPQPSALRKLLMVFKLVSAFAKLAVKQLFNNKIYELCFRIIAIAKSTKKE